MWPTAGAGGKVVVVSSCILSSDSNGTVHHAGGKNIMHSMEHQNILNRMDFGVSLVPSAVRSIMSETLD